MLQLYFDDSGSHKGSDVVLWGGVVGHSEVLRDLQDRWVDCLREPCEGFGAISTFHFTDLVGRRGPFFRATEGDRERARQNFHNAITGAGATCVACAVSVRDWNDLATPLLKRCLGSAESVALGLAIKEAVMATVAYGETLEMVFDQGRRRHLDRIIPISIEAAGAAHGQISFKFAAVKDEPCLQAADLMLGESRRFVQARISDATAVPHEQLDRLRRNAEDFSLKYADRDVIVSMLGEFQKALERAGHEAF